MAAVQGLMACQLLAPAAPHRSPRSVGLHAAPPLLQPSSHDPEWLDDCFSAAEARLGDQGAGGDGSLELRRAGPVRRAVLAAVDAAHLPKAATAAAVAATASTGSHSSRAGSCGTRSAGGVPTWWPDGQQVSHACLAVAVVTSGLPRQVPHAADLRLSRVNHVGM